MSEYQYYEFLAVDRPLTPAQVAAVRAVSTRAEITPTRFVNEYQWGDFKGSVDEFLTRYFDAHVHVTNWGARRLAFGLPRDLVERSAVEAYAHDLSLNVIPAGNRLIVDVDPRDDAGDGDWDQTDGHGWMASLAGVRAEVLAGDLRPLFLGWLAGVQLNGPVGGDPDTDRSDDPADDEATTPPVPPGLTKLSAAQQAMVDFHGIDAELLEVAAADSPPAGPPADWAAALAGVPAAGKDRWLLDLLGGGDPLAAVRIRRRLQGTPPPPASPASPARTVRQLRKAWGDLDAQRRRERAAAAAVAKAKHDAAATAARERHLSALAGRVDAAWREVDAAWREVDAFIGEKNRDGYARAVALMADLRAVAARPGGDRVAFDRHLARRLAEHRRRYAFIEAAGKAGLHEA